MSGIPANAIGDLVKTTQEGLFEKGAFVDMQTDLTDHVAAREMWEGRKYPFEGGLDWELYFQMDHNHSAKTVGLYERDGSSTNDAMVKGVVNQRHVNAHYIFDLREKAFQRGGKATVDFVKSKYVQMMVSFYELLEEQLWGKPDTSANTRDIWGLAYWVTRSATEGFNGGDPAGFSAGRAGISTSDYPRYANWTAQYADITEEDLIAKMSRASRKTKFRSPVSHSVPTIGGMGNGIYTNDSVLGQMERYLKAQNMSLGNDLVSTDGRTLFKGTPLTYAPYLDEDTTDPIYMLDWKHLGLGVLSGWEKNLSQPYMVPDMHNVMRVDLDATMNMAVTDLRRQAVIAKAAA